MVRKGRNDKTGTYIVDGWQHYVPVLSALRTGRQEFRLVYDDGRLIESVEVPGSSSRPPAGGALAGWVTMRQAAAMMGFSYYWLSRNWKQLGLHPSSPRPGVKARRMFEAKEIDEFMRDRKFTRRGRPRKVRELHG